MVYVNESLCTGCGECVDVCPSSAIRLVGSVAQIDQGLCQECEACVSACPEGAILVLQESRPVNQPIMVRSPAALSRPGLGLALSAALAFVGQEIVPRAARALLAAWDQRQARQSPVASPGRAASGAGYNSRGGGQRRRWRGGQ
ncbi:MAG: 4Fe-4S binding protein [Thermoflexales bacterium]|nr:4Fe-4S binding protein [Thermoflexales bacterium]